MGISAACYSPLKQGEENDEIADWLIRLTQTHKRWGFGLCFDYLRAQGFGWNHKRVYRIYRKLELNLRIKPHKRLKCDKPDKLAVPERLKQTWPMDFMSDNWRDGQPLRTFNVIDDFHHECLMIDSRGQFFGKDCFVIAVAVISQTQTGQRALPGLVYWGSVFIRLRLSMLAGWLRGFFRHSVRDRRQSRVRP